MMQRMRLTDDACVQVQSDVGNVAKKAKNVASDLSEDIPNLFKDVGKNAEKVHIC